MTRAKPASSKPGRPAPVHVTACTAEQIAARAHRKPVNLALQGGGSHGAFTWGVLDRLLEDDTLALDAISATSAGAMNAIVMAYGVSRGGPEGGREKLEAFWRGVSRKGRVWNPLPANPFAGWLAMTPFAAFANPAYLLQQSFSTYFSPYDFPWDRNPLREVLEDVVDFGRLAGSNHATRLFIAATNVRTGKIEIFDNRRMTAAAALASACLPYLFRAVEIGGEHYWDGGFMGNPAIFPLIYKGASRDVIVVHVNPIRRADVPKSAPDIGDRMNEISFNSPLMGEMRAIAFVQKLIEEGRLDEERYRSMLIHDIRDDPAMAAYGVDSKFSTDWGFLSELKELGRATASRWLETKAKHVGVKSTTPIRELYL
jgi:NTE family protein